MDAGDGYTTLWMYLILLNYTLKNRWNGRLHVYFTTIKITGRQQTARWHQWYQWKGNSRMLKQGSCQAGYWCRIMPLKALLECFREVIAGMTASMSLWRKEARLGFVWCWSLTCFTNTAFLRRNSNMSSYASITEEGLEQRMHSAFLTMIFAWHPSLKDLITAE